MSVFLFVTKYPHFIVTTLNASNEAFLINVESLYLPCATTKRFSKNLRLERIKPEIDFTSPTTTSDVGIVVGDNYILKASDVVDIDVYQEPDLKKVIGFALKAMDQSH